MHTQQRTWSSESGWSQQESPLHTAQLVLAFGGRTILENNERIEEVSSWYPNSNIVWCSTAGEIANTTVRDDTIVTTAIEFANTEIQVAKEVVTPEVTSEEVGIQLTSKLHTEGLRHVLVFSDGLNVNGTSLVAGMRKNLPADVSITGGLVGDGSAFKKTLVGINEAPEENNVIAIGFYGDHISIGYGSLGGWDPFGPKRLITKSKGNVLYELDQKPALKLYKEYLGEQAQKLPSSGLLFPLKILVQNESGNEVELVRTILGINEEDQSMTFAGDVPEGTQVQLMKANFERVIDGASSAASMSTEQMTTAKVELAILISCIGRKLVLKERIEEEVEAVQEVIGPQAAMTGFYSYGEICPTAPTSKQCQLHNQTMTITTFSEQ